MFMNNSILDIKKIYKNKNSIILINLIYLSNEIINNNCYITAYT